MRLMTCCRSSPVMYSMTRKGRPSAESTPASSTWVMCCVSIAPAARASRWKRLTTVLSRVRSADVMTFTATRRPVAVCSASYTDPMAPAPRRALILYLPSRVVPITRSGTLYKGCRRVRNDCARVLGSHADQPLGMSRVVALHDLEIPLLEAPGDRADGALAHLAVVDLADRRHLGGGASEERLV